MLDAIGDLYCVGKPHAGGVQRFPLGSRAQQQAAARAAGAPRGASEIVSFEDEKKAPTGFAQLSRAW
jgi:UDP-3-O-[3-hydroxymyristoyl] N-acetylglucosamine deacetylase